MALGTLILTPEQMRKMEQLYFAESGVPSIEVMEQAASALASLLVERFGDFRTIFFACGPGGNGGDGLAAARLLKPRGADVAFALAEEPKSPDAIENLRRLLQEPYPEYPYLSKILQELTELKQFTDDLQKRRLVVKVISFAYKKGIPEDPTGNGGGFVFDCRAVHNPGKYERYKPFTGLDEPVIRFLEEDGEIQTFLEHAYALVDASVKRYMERGFTNLCVSFGCTGGQHRSVYSAQHLAEHLNQKFGVQVNLVHREQNIEQTFKAKN